MRKFAWAFTALCAVTLGCNKPVETIPAVTPEPTISSGTTLDEGDHEGHEHAAEDAVPTESTGTEPAVEVEEPKVGDAVEPVEEVTNEAETPAADEPLDPSAAKANLETIRFVADKRIAVPTMMCPYSCWPKVKETLAAQPGVEAVQLAEQPAGTAEGVIEERVVELKLNGDFNADAAIAALEKVSFRAQLAE